MGGAWVHGGGGVLGGSKRMCYLKALLLVSNVNIELCLYILIFNL